MSHYLIAPLIDIFSATDTTDPECDRVSLPASPAAVSISEQLQFLLPGVLTA
ncbi:MAG: hypothetical protein ABIJ11_00955 [Elusimicrobiota bacterium]